MRALSFPMLWLRAALVLAVVAATPRARSEAAPSPEPVFADCSGRQVRVSEKAGKVVVLNFWATYCGPCRAEMPELQRLHEELGPKGLVVLGAAANGRDEVELVRKVMAERGASYETWVWVSAQDMRHYGVGPGIPATLLIGRDGTVRHRVQGVVKADALRPLLVALLEEPSPGSRP